MRLDERFNAVDIAVFFRTLDDLRITTDPLLYCVFFAVNFIIMREEFLFYQIINSRHRKLIWGGFVVVVVISDGRENKIKHS